MELAADASKGDRSADKSRDAGAVNLGDAVEIDNDLAGAVIKRGQESFGQLVGGVADGEAAVEFEEMNAGILAEIDFDGSEVGHVRSKTIRLTEPPLRSRKRRGILLARRARR